jgi:hypothetical protein
MIRSILAVLAGFLFIGAVGFILNVALLAVFPDAFDAQGRVQRTSLLPLILGYVAVVMVLGAYLTARLAAHRPLEHALVLGAFGLLFNLAGTLAQWDRAPAWYHLTALALVLPLAWLGGRLRVRQLELRG